MYISQNVGWRFYLISTPTRGSVGRPHLIKMSSQVRRPVTTLNLPITSSLWLKLHTKRTAVYLQNSNYSIAVKPFSMSGRKCVCSWYRTPSPYMWRTAGTRCIWRSQKCVLGQLRKCRRCLSEFDKTKHCGLLKNSPFLYEKMEIFWMSGFTKLEARVLTKAAVTSP